MYFANLCLYMESIEEHKVAIYISCTDLFSVFLND